MFNKNSGLVLVWYRLIKTGSYTLEQVPQLSNLKEKVQELLADE